MNYKPTNYIYTFTLYRIVQAKTQVVPPRVHVQQSKVRVMRCIDRQATRKNVHCILRGLGNVVGQANI